MENISGRLITNNLCASVSSSSSSFVTLLLGAEEAAATDLAPVVRQPACALRLRFPLSSL